jgi:hypothetical protein
VQKPFPDFAYARSMSTISAARSKVFLLFMTSASARFLKYGFAPYWREWRGLPFEKIGPCGDRPLAQAQVVEHQKIFNKSFELNNLYFPLQHHELQRGKNVTRKAS